MDLVGGMAPPIPVGYRRIQKIELTSMIKRAQNIGGDRKVRNDIAPIRAPVPVGNSNSNILRPIADCAVESLAFILAAADNRLGSMARKTVDLLERTLKSQEPQVPSKVKVAGSIPAGVAKKSTHKSRYSKSFRERIECRAE
jgi:hypothetical protein